MLFFGHIEEKLTSNFLMCTVKDTKRSVTFRTKTICIQNQPLTDEKYTKKKEPSVKEYK